MTNNEATLARFKRCMEAMGEIARKHEERYKQIRKGMDLAKQIGERLESPSVMNAPMLDIWMDSFDTVMGINTKEK